MPYYDMWRLPKRHHRLLHSPIAKDRCRTQTVCIKAFRITSLRGFVLSRTKAKEQVHQSPIIFYVSFNAENKTQDNCPEKKHCSLQQKRSICYKQWKNCVQVFVVDISRTPKFGKDCKEITKQSVKIGTRLNCSQTWVNFNSATNSMSRFFQHR